MNVKIVLLISLFTASLSTQAVTLDGVKINTAGTYGAGSTVPAWLALANTAGAFATKWNIPITIGSTVIAAAMKGELGDNFMNIMPAQNMGPKPSGWTDANTPPTTATGLTGNAACQHTTTSCIPSYAHATSGIYQTGGICAVNWEDNNNPSNASSCQTGTPLGCPTGYKDVSGTCTLDESGPWGITHWPDDQTPTWYIDQAGYFHPHERDNDNGISWGMPSNTSGVYTRQGLSDANNPGKQTITGKPGGGFTIEQHTQGTVNGSPAVQKDGFEVNKDGVVTNAWSYTINNTTINNTTDGGTAIDTSSLAQETTLQQTNGKLDQLHQDLNPTTTPTINSLADTLKQPYVDLNDNLSSSPGGDQPAFSPGNPWTWSSNTCVPYTWDAGQYGQISTDKLCLIYDTYVRTLLEFVLYFLTMLYLWHLWQQTVKE